MLKHGGGLRDEDGAEAECMVRGSEGIYGELRKGDERCFISLEEERWDGRVVVGSSVRSFFCFFISQQEEGRGRVEGRKIV